jgi:DeoR/GlpR family transcriptional regulator of sugar metabolism
MLAMSPVADHDQRDTSDRTIGHSRREQILEELRGQRSVRVSELAPRLGVSEMTIRRDLELLADAGLADKVHGGAKLRRPSNNDEPGFEIKVSRNQAEKEAIAAAAVSLIQPATAIGIGAGTTTWRLAHLLGDLASLVVVTNSVRIADVLERHGRSDWTVILTGGVRTPSDALVGPVAEQSLRTLNLDAVFLGTHGVSARAGFMSPNLAESETNRVFIEAAGRLVVLADHTKWNVSGLSSFARLDEPSAVISDTRLSAEAQDSFRERHTTLQLVTA